MARRLAAQVLALLAAVAAAGTSAPARAQVAVDVQLVLAVDVSGSVSDERFTLQQKGYAQAFRNWRLLEAIRGGNSRAIAVTMTQWTGPAQQEVVVKWMVIHDEASMLAFADAIDRTTRQLYGGGTSISGAIDHAMTLFPRLAAAGARRVIDISGDGANNRGRPILALEPHLDQYYLNNVIGGPNAFMIVAETFEAFAEAVLKKLITEISDAPADDRHGEAAPPPGP
jgi:hypothetical protein